MRVRKLLVVALVVGTGGALAQAAGSANTSTTPELIQRQGLQKQRLNQGLAATQLSQKDAKRLQAHEHAPQRRKPVTEEEVSLTRQERIRRLNASRVEHSGSP